jgi:hypothetical protein
MWDPTEFYDDLEHYFSNNAYMWDDSWFMTSLKWRKMLTCGTLEKFMTIRNTLFLKNAYMWDPTKFYDDLEHSILK